MEQKRLKGFLDLLQRYPMLLEMGGLAPGEELAGKKQHSFNMVQRSLYSVYNLDEEDLDSETDRLEKLLHQSRNRVQKLEVALRAKDALLMSLKDQEKEQQTVLESRNQEASKVRSLEQQLQVAKREERIMFYEKCDLEKQVEALKGDLMDEVYRSMDLQKAARVAADEFNKTLELEYKRGLDDNLCDLERRGWLNLKEVVLVDNLADQVKMRVNSHRFLEGNDDDRSEEEERGLTRLGQGDSSSFEYGMASSVHENDLSAHKLGSQPESKKNPKLTKEYTSSFPMMYQQYIANQTDVDMDGNCGYRVVAISMGFGHDGWRTVRQHLLDELRGNRQFYETIFGEEKRVRELQTSLDYFDDGCANREFWMTFPDMGHLIASCYDVAIIHLSHKLCLTYLPLYQSAYQKEHRGYCEGSEFAIGFVEDHSHFVKVNLTSSLVPIPPVSPVWHRYQIGKGDLYGTYEARIENFKSLGKMKNVATTDSFLDAD